MDYLKFHDFLNEVLYVISDVCQKHLCHFALSYCLGGRPGPLLWSSRE